MKWKCELPLEFLEKSLTAASVVVAVVVAAAVLVLVIVLLVLHAQTIL